MQYITFTDHLLFKSWIFTIKNKHNYDHTWKTEESKRMKTKAKSNNCALRSSEQSSVMCAMYQKCYIVNTRTMIKKA